ncbi:MAG: ATP-dependent DNA helicase RecG [Candidatus Magasanikbacteria bacterium]|nr:ATP-dependent DNA helicase RecG [Candidatus Magasanikbacteria bacterium]
MSNLNTDIVKINRVGVATAKKLKKVGVNSIYDLLLYFPHRYEDYSESTSIKNLKPQTSANVVGVIDMIEGHKSPRRRMHITEALISDHDDQIKAIWFNQPYISRVLKVGDTVSLSGKIEDDYGALQMKSPVYEKVSTKNVHTQGLVPAYHLTSNLTQKQVRYLVAQVLKYADEITDWLPKEIIKSQNLISLPQAIRQIHFPQQTTDIETAKKRLAFDELFLIQIQAAAIKNENLKAKAEIISFKEKETQDFVNSLSFKLTDAQKKTSWEIIKDLGKNTPMSRLLQGDVGSGKTIVACLALLNTALNQKQGVFMVPTEILAEQHFISLSKLLINFNIKIGLITGSSKKINFATDEKKIKPEFITQNADIIIGTHALIQEKINFKNLEFVIIDEQHRFGVEQRKTLIRKSGNPNTTPHLLSMTATPIPRSLALSLFGDLDISIINEMPKSRKPIITRVVSEFDRPKAYDFIRAQIKQGRQAFVICPLIDISDMLGVKSVKEEFEKLNKIIFPDLKIAMLHGKLKSAEKETIMADFVKNEINILVSTSVIEVGVDIPNASIMMIEGADRFGLAQLHQFRGRVGRGEHQSYCFLLGSSNSENTTSRLEAMTKYNDGLTLAKIDLKHRGPGEVYGKMQKGFPELHVASMFDFELTKQAKSEAENLILKDPELNSYPDLKIKLGEWNRNIHLE